MPEVKCWEKYRRYFQGIHENTRVSVCRQGGGAAGEHLSNYNCSLSDSRACCPGNSGHKAISETYMNHLHVCFGGLLPFSPESV